MDTTEIMADTFSSFVLHDDQGDARDTISILHIDDDESLLTISKIMLERLDRRLRITNTTDPDELFDNLHRYDLVITDYEMPNLNGIDLAERIRQISNTPIIIYTGRGSEEIAEAAFQAGIDDYIRKEMEPAHFQVFARRIQAVVEKDRALKKLRQSEKKYRLLFDNMNEAVALYKIVYGEDGKVVDYIVFDVNKSFEKVTDKRRVDLVGVTVSKIFSREFLHLEEVKDVLETGKPEVLEAYYPCIKRHFWLSVFTPGRDYVAMVYTDVTHQKQLIEELKVREERMRTVFRVSPHALVITDLRGNVFSCNDAALEIFRFQSVDEVVGLNCFSFLSPKDLERARRNWVERIKTGTMDLFMYELVTRDGRCFPANVSACVMFSDAGDPIGLVLSVEDVSEAKEIREHVNLIINALEAETLRS